MTWDIRRDAEGEAEGGFVGTARGRGEGGTELRSGAML
jgi:hypothetical protein